MFQIIFSIIWMTGYDGVTDRTSQLTIAIVNEDTSGMGSAIAGNLAEKLPFGISQPESLEAAKEQLNDRELQMVVHIPADFAQQAALPDAQAKIGFYINESNPALIKSMMSGAAETITSEVNKQAVAMGIKG